MINTIINEKSYSTAKKAYNNLNACMELGVQRGEILKNPVKGVKLPSSKTKERKEITAYTPEEIAAIVEECKRELWVVFYLQSNKIAFEYQSVIF